MTLVRDALWSVRGRAVSLGGGFVWETRVAFGSNPWRVRAFVRPPLDEPQLLLAIPVTLIVVSGFFLGVLAAGLVAPNPQQATSAQWTATLLVVGLLPVLGALLGVLGIVACRTGYVAFRHMPVPPQLGRTTAFRAEYTFAVAVSGVAPDWQEQLVRVREWPASITLGRAARPILAVQLLPDTRLEPGAITRLEYGFAYLSLRGARPALRFATASSRLVVRFDEDAQRDRAYLDLAPFVAPPAP